MDEITEKIVIACENFDETLEFFIEKLGFRMEMISPADSPSTAIISGFGKVLRLEKSDTIEPFVFDHSIPESTNEFVLTKLEDENSWNVGRAGMEYRDLIPSRLGGRFIASHIRIETGGEVPDYVHFHRVRFQMIYCLSGWAKLVYEDQGEPFLMKAGDCVLQPPQIRHRVLECSDKFEVLEIGCPAVHETFAEHEFDLPNENFNPERIFDGQKFVHHSSEKSVWQDSEFENFEICDTQIAKASNNLADVRVFRASVESSFNVKHSDEFMFFFVICGNVSLGDKNGANYLLKSNDGFVLPSGEEFFIKAETGAEILRINLTNAEK